MIRCSARELTGTFTVAVISNLLLGKEAEQFQEYQAISQAIGTCMDHAMMKFVWMKPTEQQERDYQNALNVLRGVINGSQGEFYEKLQKSGLTQEQIKGILLLLYIAGGETSASLLEYLLWQLGQNPAYQNEIHDDIRNRSANPGSLIDRIIQEGLRLHTPAALIGRTAKKDLEISVKTGVSTWKYHVAKGQNILISPYFSGRDRACYEDADQFNPNREELTENSYPWNPFGRGKHGCPGKWLALAEIREILEAILGRYSVVSDPDKVPRQKELMTLTLDPKVTLTLTRRAN